MLDEFELRDVARKVVGVGSVGTRCWLALMMGRETRDPLFLQVKEANASVLEPFLERSEFANHGERMVVGQRLMQTVSDIFLRWFHVPEGFDGKPRDFCVRQLKDWKGSVRIELMPPRSMELYGKLCGSTLARAHARSGDRIATAFCARAVCLWRRRDLAGGLAACQGLKTSLCGLPGSGPSHARRGHH